MTRYVIMHINSWKNLERDKIIAVNKTKVLRGFTVKLTRDVLVHQLGDSKLIFFIVGERPTKFYH
jgi:hypothetical protein